MITESVKMPSPKDSIQILKMVSQRAKPKKLMLNGETMPCLRRNLYHGTASSCTKCWVSSPFYCGSDLHFASLVSVSPKIKKTSLTFILVSYLLSLPF
jgi:hypothetical protein